MPTPTDEDSPLGSVLESMDDSVIALDDAARVEMANAAARRLLELPDDVSGRPLGDCVELPDLHQLIARAQRGEPGSVEFEFPEGGGRFVHARATHQTDGGVVLVMRDVTEIRRLERVRRDFVANVSHELRTPVSIIKANAETLIDGALERPEQARLFVEALLRHADRLGRLISDLLDISRIEAGKYPMNVRSTELGPIVKRILEVVEAKAETKDMALVSKIKGHCAVAADQKALEQVLLNLVENAVKYTPDRGCVEIDAVVMGTTTRLEIRDDGPGIDELHRPRIFERFYRVDTGRSREMGGTGLGLAIVKHLVEAMHGRVGVEPRQPHGSIFWITLPTAQ